MFATFAEVSQLDPIVQAGQRQELIVQGQSLNLMIHPATPTEDLNALHLEAWKRGVKSLYYQHSVNAAQEFDRDLLGWIFEAGELDVLPQRRVEAFLQPRFDAALGAVDLAPLFAPDPEEVAATLWFEEEIVAGKRYDFFHERPTAYTRKTKAITAGDLFEQDPSRRVFRGGPERRSPLSVAAPTEERRGAAIVMHDGSRVGPEVGSKAGPRRTSVTTPPAGRCPFPHGTTRRKSGRGESPDAPAIERKGDVWHLRSYATVRQVLRDADATRQAGFNSEAVIGTRMERPVLFQDGAEHKEQRTAIARFFTPKTVGDEYRALMEGYSDEAVATLLQDGRGDLGALSMRLAVRVAARVVGLTDSRRPGMDRRLEALLSLERLRRPSRLRRVTAHLKSRVHLLRFYLQDVRPAIAARRGAPRRDVIGHLLGRGRNDMEILIECVTYGAAGMVTTREFIGMAAWHLLEDEALRRDYLAADEAERHRILHEILRLEPVVGHLYRRAAADLRVDCAGETYAIPAGALLDLDIRSANADPEAVGDEPLGLCPHRELARGVQPPVLSFGDGGHRCPGAFIAIQESDIFLQRLLRLPLEVESAPRLGWNDLVEGYELRGFEVAVGPAAGAPPGRGGARPAEVRRAGA